jgi:hypothetical protein
MADRLPLTPDEFRQLASGVVDLAAGMLARLPEERAFPTTSGGKPPPSSKALLRRRGWGRRRWTTWRQWGTPC